MTSKQRAYLKSLASNLDPIFQVGKSSLTPQVTEAIFGWALVTRDSRVDLPTLGKPTKPTSAMTGWR